MKGEFGTHSKFAKLLNVNEDLGRAVYSLVKTKTYAKSRGVASGFLNLIEEHSACEAIDSRDMIYALQGIVRADQVPFPNYADILSPNYNITPDILYTGVTRSMLILMKNLRFIQYNREAPFVRENCRLYRLGRMTLVQNIVWIRCENVSEITAEPTFRGVPKARFSGQSKIEGSMMHYWTCKESLLEVWRK